MSAGDAAPTKEKSVIATDAQERKLMEELKKHGKLGLVELFENREQYDPQCGKVEMFVDGVGDALRGE